MASLKKNITFADLTTLQIGGPVKDFKKVSTIQQLINTVKLATQKKIKFLVIGSGSNLLVSDEGFDGLVIQNCVKGIEQKENTLTVKTGTVLQDLVDFSIAKGLSGLQKLTGIPGTVGGAIYGNAGAYGQVISDHLVEVKAFDGEKVITLSKNECQFDYRDSGFKKTKYTLLESKFSLPGGNFQELEKESKEVLEKRLVKYPKGIKCPGSFFKNLVADKIDPQVLQNIPPELVVYGKIPAGALLEKVGAKGQRQGNIEIAPYHANLFVNLGGGKAQDFYNLARKYAQKVKEKFGITLEPEVQLINLPPIE